MYESAGDADAALDCYRSLLAGYDPGSAQWFNAKVHLLRLLIETDPARAREVFDQHKLLYPDLAPEPFRSQMRAIERDLQQPGGP